MVLTVDFVRRVIPHSSVLAQGSDALHSFSIDSRTLKKGDIFFPLTGAKTDGHAFIEQALMRGAAGFFIDHKNIALLEKIDKKVLQNCLIIACDDTYKTLIDLATAYRNEITCPVIGITGSVGKTSTKEILCHILSANQNSFIATPGNQNTLLGVALTVLSYKPAHQMMVLELGISKRGEMAALVALAKPTIGIITAIGHSHMEGLGSIIDIAAEKREIFKLFKHDSIGIIHGDQPLLAQYAYTHPVIKFGCKTTNQVQARKILTTAESTSFILKLYGSKHKITLKGTHKGVVFNCLAAACAAYLLRIDIEKIVEGLEMPLKVVGRFEQRPLKIGKGIIINDCYNASPESMKAALTAFQSMATQGQKIVILGDMLELGVNSPFWHRQLGRFLRKVPTLRQLILVGNMVEWTKKMVPLGVKVDIVPSWKEASELLKDKVEQESAVLVKGSLAVGLEHLVDMFT